MGRQPPVGRPSTGGIRRVVLVLAAAVLSGCSAGVSRPSATGAPAATAPSTGPSTTGPSTTGASSTTAPATPATGAEGVPAFSHVFVVLMENLGATQALAVPSLAALAARYQSSTDWYAASHPSLPNYLALISGSTWGVTSDCTGCYQSGPTLASQLDAAGVSWDAFFGGMPAPCFLRPQSADGSYAQKHDPFAYFAAVRSSAAECAHLRPLSDLSPLLAGPAAAMPHFVWVTPTMCDSGHDCPPATAGAWLTGFVGQVTASAAWKSGGLLVVTWDEGEGDDSGLDTSTGTPGGAGGGRVLTLVIAPGAPSGRSLSGPFDHYSLLRTVEDSFGLAHLGHAADPGVRTLAPFFAGGNG